MAEYHYWVGNITGCIFSTSNVCPVKNQKIDRLKYMGYTSDTGWPKKMNTGRILYKSSNKMRRIQKKKCKILLNTKTN